MDFDDEATSPANKVDDVMADRVLPPETNARKSFPQAIPKKCLGRRRFFPK